MKLPDGTEIDLDNIEKTLTALFEHAMKLAGECWREGIEARVPERYLHKHAPMPGEADIRVLPDVYTTHIEYSGEIWHHGDTDYVSTVVDREVLEGTKTPAQWAAEVRVYADEQEAKIRLAAEYAETQKEERAREARYRNYIALKAEFEGPAKQQSTHDEWVS